VHLQAEAHERIGEWGEAGDTVPWHPGACPSDKTRFLGNSCHEPYGICTYTEVQGDLSIPVGLVFGVRRHIDLRLQHPHLLRLRGRRRLVVVAQVCLSCKLKFAHLLFQLVRLRGGVRGNNMQCEQERVRRRWWEMGHTEGSGGV
jgi:hypothetical protein